MTLGSADEINFLRQSRECLVKVVSSTTRCTIFDELRFENFTGKKASPNFQLQQSYLYRCFFIIQEQTSICNKTKSRADLCEFGWVIHSDATFRPDKMCCYQCQNIMPSYVGANQNSP